jgi:hypothetical protein
LLCRDKITQLYDIAASTSIIEGYDGAIKGAIERKDKGRRKYRKKNVDVPSEVCDNVETT